MKENLIKLIESVKDELAREIVQSYVLNPPNKIEFVKRLILYDEITNDLNSIIEKIRKFKNVV